MMIQLDICRPTDMNQGRKLVLLMGAKKAPNFYDFWYFCTQPGTCSPFNFSRWLRTSPINQNDRPCGSSDRVNLPPPMITRMPPGSPNDPLSFCSPLLRVCPEPCWHLPFKLLICINYTLDTQFDKLPTIPQLDIVMGLWSIAFNSIICLLGCEFCISLFSRASPWEVWSLCFYHKGKLVIWTIHVGVLPANHVLIFIKPVFTNKSDLVHSMAFLAGRIPISI